MEKVVAFSLFSNLLIKAQISTLQPQYKLQLAAPSLLTEFIQNPMLELAIRNHGCWCAKLDPLADQSVLGGPDTVDDLDLICKRWAHARRCSKVSGRCENSTFLGVDSYEVEYSVDINDARCSDSDNCLSEVCQIDLSYVNEIINHVMANPGGIPVTAVCTVVTRVPNGKLPNCNEFETTPYNGLTTQPVVSLEELCRDTPMDLVFVVDGSGSVGQSNFDKQIEFAKRVTEYRKNEKSNITCCVKISIIFFHFFVDDHFSN